MTNLADSYTLVIKAKDLESDQYDLATVPITLSLWNVQRNNASKAPATSGMGCTIAELADEIGLKPSEFRAWLTIPTEYVPLANGDVVHRNDLGLDTPLGIYTFSIPNTIYMAWFGEMTVWNLPAGQAWMGWNQNATDLESLGFCVKKFNNDTYSSSAPNTAKTSFLTRIAALSERKELHGMYMMGHGSSTSVGSTGTRWHTQGPDWSVEYSEINAVLSYKLGALIIHACHSADGDAISLTSQNGSIFVGQHGVYVPVFNVERIASHWGSKCLGPAGTGPGGTFYIYDFGGKQKTKIFGATIQK